MCMCTQRQTLKKTMITTETEESDKQVRAHFLTLILILNVFLLASLQKKFAQFKDAKKGGVQKAIPISPPVKATHSLLLSCYIVHVLTSMYFLALCNKARVVSLSGKGTCCLKTSRQSRNCARLQFKKEKNKIIVGSAREGAKERERKGDLM